MAMLAEPRRKQKWTLNPRGKQWSDDSNKFGQKMLEKMGWSSGKGLGANLDGMTEHIKARYKNDQGGIGFSKDDEEKQWTQHQEGYNDLLQQLRNGETAEASQKDSELSGKSLELKSKHSRARVHYQKFTRGKDVNKYSSKDLANIFGKKDLDDKSEVPVPVKVEIQPDNEELALEPVGSSDTSHGIVTVKGGSIADYLKNKMSLNRKTMNSETANVKNESESEEERYPGFDYARSQSKSEKRNKIENLAFENPALDIDSAREIRVTPSKRKIDYVFENPALDLGDNPGDFERTPKRRKSEFAFENNGLDPSLKTDEKISEDIVKREPADGALMRAGSSMSGESVDSCGKKKRRKKSKECSFVAVEGFTNDALNLDIQENNDEPSNGAQFEIARSHFGLANDALDLTDESNGKKRVTFNETVEYEEHIGRARGKKKKAKSAVKLDKFEVDNEKLKKKRNKGKKSTETIVIDCAFSNEAMDLEIVSQEANDNAVNERKMERERRKRQRRISSLETIKEAPEEDKQDTSIIPAVVTLDESLVGDENGDLETTINGTTKEKRKKKKKDRKDQRVSHERENLSTEIHEVEFIGEMKSTKMCDGNESGMIIKEKQPNETVVIAEVHDTGKESKKCKKRQSLDVETTMIQEIEECNENAEAFKGEKRKRRSKEKPGDCTDKENIQVILENSVVFESEKKRKKRNKEKKENTVENGLPKEKTEFPIIECVPQDISEARDEPFEGQSEPSGGLARPIGMQDVLRSPWDIKARKSKATFKSLFARSPAVIFPGSNINEIKGYGVE